MQKQTSDSEVHTYEQEEAIAEALNVSLFNSELTKLYLASNPETGLSIRLVFNRDDFPSNSNKLILEFKQIESFSFNYNSDYFFYRVETAKLLKLATTYYLSLDPDDSLESPSDSDQDCVIARYLRLTYPAQ